MSDNKHNPSLYEVHYHKKFLSFWFGGRITVICPSLVDLNSELHDILPNLTFNSQVGFLEMYTWYECPVKNDEEANEYIIELKLRGYTITREKTTLEYYDVL